MSAHALTAHTLRHVQQRLAASHGHALVRCPLDGGAYTLIRTLRSTFSRWPGTATCLQGRETTLAQYVRSGRP
eukprot:8341923-Alexandrium_andersonii.AAC.1